MTFKDINIGQTFRIPFINKVFTKTKNDSGNTKDWNAKYNRNKNAYCADICPIK